MGLDQYAYVASKQGQRDEFWEHAVLDPETKEYANPKVQKPREIAYWRKHPNLQGYMRELWIRKLQANGKCAGDDSDDGSFNGVEVELTWQDLDDLERAVTHGQLPTTAGFFFGDPSDEYYRKSDLEFIKNARAEIFLGLKVFYNSSW